MHSTKDHYYNTNHSQLKWYKCVIKILYENFLHAWLTCFGVCHSFYHISY